MARYLSNDPLVLYLFVMSGTGYGQKLELVAENGVPMPSNMAFSPDGRLFAIAAEYQIIKLFDVESGKELRSFSISDSVDSIAFSSDSKMLSFLYNNEIQFWSVINGKEVKARKISVDIKAVPSISAYTFSLNGKTLAAHVDEENIELWDLGSKKMLKSFKHDSPYSRITFGQSGKLLVSEVGEDEIKLRDLETKQVVKIIKIPVDELSAYYFSFDLQSFAALQNNELKLWNAETGSEPKKIDLGSNLLTAAPIVDKDKNFLAVANLDRQILLYDLRSKKLLGLIKGHETIITRMAFSRDGSVLVSMNKDEMLKVWTVEENPSLVFDYEGNLPHRDYSFLKQYSIPLDFLEETGNTVTNISDQLSIQIDVGTRLKIVNRSTKAEVATLIGVKSKGLAVVTPNGRFDASDEAQKSMHYVYGLEIINFEQLEEMYYESGLLQKLLGSDKKPLRSIMPLKDIKLYPEIVLAIIERILQKIDPAMGGPIFFQHSKMILRLVMSNPKKIGTLAQFYQIFCSSDYFKKFLPLYNPDAILQKFVDETLINVNYSRIREYDGSSLGMYIGSKYEPFIGDPMLRNIFGQPRSTINLKQIMDEGKILLVNLSKGRMGELNARFFGMVLIAKMQAATMSRADIPESERRDFYLYVDEFQNLATQNFSVLLAEARKYRLNLILTNQFVTQVSKEIMDAITGNVGTIISFRVGSIDAEFLERDFLPTFNNFDLMNLPNFHTYVSTLTGGEVSKPFSMRIVSDFSEENIEQASRIRENSRLIYGKRRKTVESKIEESLKHESPETVYEIENEYAYPLLKLYKRPVKELELYKRPVKELELSNRPVNILRKAGILTVRQLQDRTEAELLEINNLGKIHVKEIKEALQKVGLNLDGDYCGSEDF